MTLVSVSYIIPFRSYLCLPLGRGLDVTETNLWRSLPNTCLCGKPPEFRRRPSSVSGQEL